MMYSEITEGLIRTVIADEFHKFAEAHSEQWKELASDYAVQMLAEIRGILDENISLEEMRTKIMKIVLFLDTPPYPQRTNNSYYTFK